jgi:hypothetical protein
MNQNIEMMPPVGDVLCFLALTNNITQTTAHLRYTNQSTCDQYGIPTHLLSVSIDPSQYTNVPFEQKRDTIAISLDYHPLKQEIMDRIQSELPQYNIVEVKNMAYSDYKQLVAHCKFMITFGEGFDGYFIETVFSGGIAFAVYNESFFPSSDYKKLSNVYSSYEAMLERIVSSMKQLDNAQSYSSLNHIVYAKLKKIYDYESYIENIKKFYMHNYSFTPSKDAVNDAVRSALQQNAVKVVDLQFTIDEKTLEIESQRLEIESQRLEIHELNLALQKHISKIDEQNLLVSSMVNSSSWKVTKPLRAVNKRAGRKKSKP